MINQEKVIKGLTCHVHGNPQTRCHKCPYWGTGPHGLSQCSLLFADALALLKAQEPRVLTLEEIKDYLADPDGDKKPLWLEWSTIPALSGWVLASNVNDLMKRYIDTYNIKWRPWTTRPTDAQREAAAWES